MNFNQRPLIENWQFGFQDPASYFMDGIINFHHDLFFFLSFILFFVLYLWARAIMLFNNKANKDPIIVTHGATIEIIWTTIPALILVLIAIPSFSLLYSMDEIVEPLFTVKVIGHQWYWSYEFLDPNVLVRLYGLSTDGDINVDALELESNYAFDSYMLPDEDVAAMGDEAFRLLEVDNKLYLPAETNIRVLITSSDVIHSWAVPALGIKIDACPGRANITALFIKRSGVFYGQCSEICGINHGFMPIAIMSLYMNGDGSVLDVNNVETIIPLLSFLKRED